MQPPLLKEGAVSAGQSEPIPTSCDSLRKETSQLLWATCSRKKNGISFYFNALCYYFKTLLLNK